MVRVFSWMIHSKSLPWNNGWVHITISSIHFKLVGLGVPGDSLKHCSTFTTVQVSSQRWRCGTLGRQKPSEFDMDICFLETDNIQNVFKHTGLKLMMSLMWCQTSTYYRSWTIFFSHTVRVITNHAFRQKWIHQHHGWLNLRVFKIRRATKRLNLSRILFDSHTVILLMEEIQQNPVSNGIKYLPTG